MITRNVHNNYASNVNIHIKLIWLPVVFVLFLVNTRKLFLFVSAMYYIARYIPFLIRLKHNQHVQLNTGKLVLKSGLFSLIGTIWSPRKHHKIVAFYQDREVRVKAANDC